MLEMEVMFMYFEITDRQKTEERRNQEDNSKLDRDSNKERKRKLLGKVLYMFPSFLF